MTDFTWYSRFGVWLGAVVLLVESVTGRGSGVVTVLAVLVLSVGFVAFICGLARDGATAEAPLPESAEPDPPEA